MNGVESLRDDFQEFVNREIPVGSTSNEVDAWLVKQDAVACFIDKSDMEFENLEGVPITESAGVRADNLIGFTRAKFFRNNCIIVGPSFQISIYFFIGLDEKLVKTFILVSRVGP
jgi:hypothetical protein